MKLLQKCIVEIDEEGMKAAAATSVDGASESVGPIMKTDMTVNRPFIFAIYERSTGVLLFVGRINKA